MACRGDGFLTTGEGVTREDSIKRKMPEERGRKRDRRGEAGAGSDRNVPSLPLSYGAV